MKFFSEENLHGVEHLLKLWWLFNVFREEYYHLVKNLRNFPYFLQYLPCLEKWKNGYFSHFLFLLPLLMPKWSNTIFIFFLLKINKENSIYWKSENLRKPQIWENPTLVSWPLWTVANLPNTKVASLKVPYSLMET